MSDLHDLGGAAAGGAVVTAVFTYLGLRAKLNASKMGHEGDEWSKYRAELKADLIAARNALDAMKTERVAMMEKEALARIHSEERITALESEKSECQERIGEMANQIHELTGEVAALRAMVKRGLYEDPRRGSDPPDADWRHLRKTMGGIRRRG